MPTRWIEDWFGSDYYSHLYSHRNNDEAERFISRLTDHLALKSGSRVLDAGCGRGRHSLCLLKKDMDVTGIDVSESCIEKAKAHESTRLHFYKHDLRHLFRTNYFEAIFCLFTSFGYFESDYQNNKAFESLAKGLRPNGWMVLDYMNVQKELAELVPSEEIAAGNLRFSIERKKDNDLLRKMITIHDNGQVLAYKEQVRLYTAEDLKKFFIRNGIDIVHLFGSYSLEEFHPSNSDRLILIGKKA